MAYTPKRFSEYLSEETNEITFVFGRFNPPTNGHEKVFNALKNRAGSGQFRIYASQSNDPKKNPLKFKDKIKFLRKMFPKYGRNIMSDSNIRTVFDIAVRLYDQGFTKVNMVVGEDRLAEFDKLLNKYNGEKGRHGFYQFEGGVQVTSAGARDPDSDDVSGMSASKLRAAASANDFSAFSKGMPSGYKGGKELFNAIRKGMGLKESYNHRKHIQLETVSEKREEYVNGDLFKEGDTVVVKESSDVGTITMTGSNYVLVEFSDGKKKRCWLDSVEKLEEKSKQDPDIKDKKGTQPAEYHKGLAKSTKDKRDAHFKKGAKMDDDNPAAYKPAPGDAQAKTKPSKHTKKYKQMFGEDKLEEKKIAGLVKKAEKTGMPYGILKKVYDRGVAAWRTGHRPGTNPQQWGFARVNSFVTKSPGTWGKADKDLAKQVRGESYEFGTNEYTSHTKEITPGELDEMGALSSIGFDDLDRFIDRTLKKPIYKKAVRYYLDQRKKSSGDTDNAQKIMKKTAKVVGLDYKNLNKTFHDMIKKGLLPKHLAFEDTKVSFKDYLKDDKNEEI
tara:strand:+ start:93 stop:1763 length:1671 start_codon:yes stop_codon:yes gene_type:complete